MPRVEVDKSLKPILVPGRIVSELLKHALDTLPEECCGLLVGSDEQRYRRLVRCDNVMTERSRKDPATYPRDGRSAYLMNEADYMRTLDEAEVAGERVTAVYHSHVGAEAYLSEMDLEYARNPLFPFPDADQIVVAVPSPDASHLTLDPEEDEVPRIGIFVWDPGASTFRGQRVRPSVP